MNNPFPRCTVVPLPDQQVSLRIDGRERTRWHYGSNSPRPFFYPFVGPGGASLTRMGHPGAPNHDHHRSIWFAHAKVLGIDFWSENSPARIRQTEWLAYRDGDDEAVMAVHLGWFDGHNPAPLMEQELIAAVIPQSSGATLLEIQATFSTKSDQLELQRTNFGFLAVRVAKSLSAHFGGGQLRDSEGRIGEPEIFGKTASWMDYRGPILDANQQPQTEGITFFDHPTNPRSPTNWHIREDGWMGAAVCFSEPVNLGKSSPLTFRYLLLGSRSEWNSALIEDLKATEQAFEKRPKFEVIKATVKHETWTVRRLPQ